MRATRVSGGLGINPLPHRPGCRLQLCLAAVDQDMRVLCRPSIRAVVRFLQNRLAQDGQAVTVAETDDQFVNLIG